MSRSYKKNPIIQVPSGRAKKWHKRQAAKKARKAQLVNGKHYKKHYPQYDICDQWCRRTWAEFVRVAYNWTFHKHWIEGHFVNTPPTKEDLFGWRKDQIVETWEYTTEAVWEPSGYAYDKWVKSNCEQPFEIWLRGEFKKDWIGK